MKGGDVILSPETFEGEEPNVTTTKWIITPKKTSKIYDPKPIGKIWFSTQPERGEIEIDFEVTSRETETAYMRDAVRVLINWAFSGNNIYEIACTCKHKEQDRIDVLERAGLVYRYGDREIESYSIVKPQPIWLGLYFVIGFVSGLILGIVLNSMVMGLVIGLIAGILSGAVLDTKAKNEREKVTGERKPIRRVPVKDISIKEDK